MAEYLTPLASELSITEKCEIFEIRNKMKRNIPANFSSSNIKHKCLCGSRENMKHIYLCKELNIEEPETDYDFIYSNNIKKVKQVFERYVINDNKREELLNKIQKSSKHEN